MKFLAAIFLATICSPALAADPVVGRASVTDGDTVVIQTTRIRLHGIDAPESAQLCQDQAGKDYRCGQAAALALADRIGASPISCEPKDTDRYGRTVAVCRKGSEDLNEWMVRQGHAVAYRQYGTEYIPAEDAAKASQRGIWGGTFQVPSEWRKAKRMGSGQAATTQPPGACVIKGNISRSGEKIYHLPESRDYEKTRISERSGERMFCSEDEAKAAGWRPPRG